MICRFAGPAAEGCEAFLGRGKNRKLSLMKEMLVGAVGIGPTTFGLKGRCSTTELRP